MRQIKFRGKSEKNGWLYGSLVIIENESACYEPGTFYIHLYRDGGHSMYEVDPETVGQFTGLLDKNEKEIYEGDVVKSEHHNPENYLIEFIEGAFCGTYGDDKDYPININHFYPSPGCQIEVVGNKTDNLELLN